jgi:hypothetical protein
LCTRILCIEWARGDAVLLTLISGSGVTFKVIDPNLLGGLGVRGICSSCFQWLVGRVHFFLSWNVLSSSEYLVFCSTVAILIPDHP